MVNLFCGYDPRESIGFHVFVSSVIERASVPVRIVPMTGMGLRQGSNAFTLSRFLVAEMMGFHGRAIFADASDMLCLDDIAKLDAMFDSRYAVQVVKRVDYTSRHQRKYIGTPMECEQSNYSRKNWASLMLINCAHQSWWTIRKDTIESYSPLDLLQLRFCESEIGHLPYKWNVLADEGDPTEGASLLHFTAGIPAFDHYADSPGADLWKASEAAMIKGAGVICGRG